MIAMATFNSFAALERQITKDMQSAVNRAKGKIEMELFMNVNGYYDGSTPQRYQRTGTLLTSPDSTPVQGSGKHLEFSVYMDEGITYRTGSFSGGQVTIGNHGYFQRTEEAAQKILDSEFNNI